MRSDQAVKALARALLSDEREAAIRPSLEERIGHIERVEELATAIDTEPAPVFTTRLERLARPHAEHPPAVAFADGDGTPASEQLSGCLERIEAHNGTLHAFVAVDADRARASAAALDAEGGRRSLHGMPIGIKDVIDVEGLPTEAGSPLFAGNHAGADATAVRRLRAAGAVVLGKTTCTELATNDPAPTVNPWNADHTPGGSSPGSAVAVATGMCHATLDTQTAGDILRPAAYNGVVGFKPTYGRISRHGSLGVAWSIDTIGVQACSVADAARLFAVLAGPDPADPTSSQHPLDPDGQTGTLRLGRIRDYEALHADEEVQAHVETLATRAADAGAELVDLRLGDDLAAAHAAHRIICFSECAALHAERLHRDADRMGPKLRTLLELGAATPATTYVQAQRVRADVLARVHDAIRGIDAILTAPAPSPPPRDLSGTGNSVLQIPWTLLGLPAISLPTGLSADGLPLAVQLVGRPFREADLLGAATWIQDTLGTTLDVRPRLAGRAG
jgi:Asp-tRNA(Asn)/Glu-tRNA(Gln) amidotransferase A subunit family amidase